MVQLAAGVAALCRQLRLLPGTTAEPVPLRPRRVPSDPVMVWPASCEQITLVKNRTAARAVKQLVDVLGPPGADPDDPGLAPRTLL